MDSLNSFDAIGGYAPIARGSRTAWKMGGARRQRETRVVSTENPLRVIDAGSNACADAITSPRWADGLPLSDAGKDPKGPRSIGIFDSETCTHAGGLYGRKIRHRVASTASS